MNYAIISSLKQTNKPLTIGIDQSLTGFAMTALVIDDPNEFACWVYKSPHFGIERLLDIQEWMIARFDELGKKNIKNVAMEGTVLASQAALVLGELSALVRITLHGYYKGVEEAQYPLKVPPMTLKKFAAGKGNAKKQEMLLQIYKRWGIEFNNDNAADSYALARLASGNSINQVEKDIINQMKDPKYRDQPRL